VRSSNADDQIALMQWMFGVLALAPAVQPFSSITPTQRETLNRKGADLFVRLLSDDCRQQSIDGQIRRTYGSPRRLSGARSGCGARSDDRSPRKRGNEELIELRFFH